MEYTEEKPGEEVEASPVSGEAAEGFECMNYHQGGLREYEDELNAERDHEFQRQFFLCGC